MILIKPILTEEEKKEIDKMSIAELKSAHNRGLNGHPDYWNYVNRRMNKLGLLK